MITRTSKTEEIKAQLRREGKIQYLDQPQHTSAIQLMNEQLSNIRQEYQGKERDSQILAASATITNCTDHL